jgi:UDP-N-acetylglucosamine/UDP-N-acetyl-alpha-D-glucosaminouronate 4-epimerase
MQTFSAVKQALWQHPRSWLITGVAGFIGSNLLEALLRLDQRVTGLDNFATGHARNLERVRQSVESRQWEKFRMIDGDIQDAATCLDACEGVDYLLHQAALGSVPRSIKHPLDSNATNVTGFLNMLVAARDNKVRRFVYASSSSVYGDSPDLPKVEERIGQPLSPYAVTKCVNELYAGVFARCYALETIGLRYFNVFGPGQDPEGPYAAVIPRWIAAMIWNEAICIYGDGETSRDFCYVANVVQANLLAATTVNPSAVNQVYNVAVGERTTLNELFRSLKQLLLPRHPHLADTRPVYEVERPGDVRHSHADIDKVRRLLEYEPTHRVKDGLQKALAWYDTSLASAATETAMEAKSVVGVSLA